MTKDVFEKNVKDLLSNEMDGILVSQIPQRLKLSNEELSEIKKLYGTNILWKLLGKIDGIEISGPDDRKKAVLKSPETEKEISVPSNDTTMPVTDNMKILLKYLNQNLYGRQEAVRLAVLSAVANESIFFMGPPGTGKSMVCRRLAAAFSDFYIDGKFSTEIGNYFEYLMNEFSTPDELCGPVDLSGLNDKPSRYERQIAGYLPSAKVAFLDEIWKSGPAILNTLLTIVNEKIYRVGNITKKVPLISLVAASNELPEKNRGLDALWDRFIIRVFVNPVENDDDFFKLINDGNKELVLTDEYKSVLLKFSDIAKWQNEIDKIELPENVKTVIIAIRKELDLLNADGKHKAEDGENYYVSPRRWKKIVHILKTSAFLNGRKSIDLMDCSLIEYAIWNTDKQHNEASGIIEKILSQNGIGKSTAIGDITDKLDDFKKAVDEKWFDHIVVKAVPEKKSEPIIVKVDGKNCYECTRDGTSETWYVTENATNRNYYSGNYHSIYDSSKNFIREYSFSKSGMKITCYHNFTINMSKAVAAVPAKNYYESKLFEPVAKRTIMEAFDKEEYTPILNQIDTEIKDLKNFRAENEKPFTENAFADVTKYKPILFNKINDSIKKLEDIKLKLKEQHDRYASDSNIKANFVIGDLIMKDGTYTKSNSKTDESEVISKVCLIGDEVNAAYGLSVEDFGEVTFNKAKEIVSNYGKGKFSAPYNSGWELPTLEQLTQIYENVHDNNNFNFTGKYWSSTVESNNAVNCIDFDSGEKDHTTDDHEFKVLLIRKLGV